MIATPAAIEFAAPGWLYGLAVVALPVLAHLSARRTGPPVLLPTQRFVALAIRQYQHRRAPIDYLLLALRCLIVALIVLAFAQPRWASTRLPTLEKRGLQEAVDMPRENPVPTQLNVAVVSDEDADDPATATFYLKRLGDETADSGWRVEVVRGGDLHGFDAAIVLNDADVDVPAVRIVGTGESAEDVTLEPMDPRSKPWEVFEGPAMTTLREVRFRAVEQQQHLPGASDVLARWSNLEPAVWWDPRNARTLVFNADISPAASDLVRSAAFVPLMHELMETALRPDFAAVVSTPMTRPPSVEKRALWRWLLAGALVLIGVETIVAGGIGSRYTTLRAAAVGMMVVMLVWPAVSEVMDRSRLKAANNEANVAVRLHVSSNVAYVGEPISLTATIHQQGFDGRSVTVELLADDEPVARVGMVFRDGEPPGTPNFRHIVGRGGEWIRYSVRIEPLEGESDVIDNVDEVIVRRVEGRIEVLMIEGEPAWTTRWFADAMRRDGRIALTQRVAYGNDRSAIVGQAYEAIADFDVIVLGRQIERLMNREEVESLADFVTRRGGGVIFARGTDVTNDAESAKTLASIIPMDGIANDGTVSMRIGAGRVIVVRDKDRWLEAMRAGASDAYRNWVGRIIRFAAFADDSLAGEPVDLTVDPMNVELGGEVSIEARLRQKIDDASMRVQDPAGHAAAVEMMDEYGKLIGRYRPAALGLHVVELNADELDGPVCAAFLVKPATVAEDEPATATIEGDRAGPMLGRWWMFALLIGLLSVEWFTRRTAGLR